MTVAADELLAIFYRYDHGRQRLHCNYVRVRRQRADDVLFLFWFFSTPPGCGPGGEDLVETRFLRVDVVVTCYEQRRVLCVVIDLEVIVLEVLLLRF
jgi:hypothetical protein